MTNYYVENAEKWKALASIDYFTHFVKAWIPFNAWYRNCYPSLRTDWEIMQEVKTSSNSFKDKLVSLIQNPAEDNESRIFKAQLHQLHYQLDRKYIYNSQERITFTNIVVENNTKTTEEIQYRGFTYRVEVDINNRNNINALVLDRHLTTRLSIIQQNGYNLVEIENHSGYQRLSAEQKTKLISCYQEINPRKPVTMLTSDTDNCIDVGSYHFVNDAALIAKAVITVIYNLRNALFHGQIVPDRETQKVYQPAYQILAILVEALS